MNADADYQVLAFVPSSLQGYMQELESAGLTHLARVNSIEELLEAAQDRSFAVVLIPATGIPVEQWWPLWGCISDMLPRPSILVYALRSDFQMWSSVLESGGFDVILAPFTARKLSQAIKAAAAECIRIQQG